MSQNLKKVSLTASWGRMLQPEETANASFLRLECT